LTDFLRRTLIALLLSTAITSPILFADGIGAQVDTAWYGSVPSSMHEDDLPIRTHLSLGGTLEPIRVDLTDQMSLSGGVSFRYITRSIPYGSLVWSSFIAAGPSVALNIHMTQRWSVSAALALFGGVYLHTWELAPFARFTLAPQYAASKHTAKQHLSASFPIAIDLRTDYFAISAGVGIQWHYDFHREPK
jgi:hypothetical protein